MSEKDSLFFKKRGFGKRIGFGKKGCLIVIDAIVGFTDSTMPLGYELNTQLRNINKVIKVCRSLNIPIIFTTIAYETSKIEESNIWIKKMEGLKTLSMNSKAVEIDNRLDFNNNDTLIVKKHASAFFGTDLVTKLNTVNADTVIITGFTTSGCIRSTVVDAIQYGYRPVVIEDATGDRSDKSHVQSIFDMEQKYADVILTDNLMTYINE